ncbi:MAG: (2Fe-2S)-binding protein [Treponema sp.]|nr:MAG: (2Fe-2S)-binding protein [Treponema sp.]
MRITFILNKTKVQIESEPNERLITVLRREFGLTSVKNSDYYGLTGSCTVLLNDYPVPASIIPVFNIEGKEIITLEYFQKMSEYKTIMSVFKQAGVQMCGYCNAGKIFTVYEIIKSGEMPNTEHIKRLFNGQICRCTSIKALQDAIKKIKFS